MSWYSVGTINVVNGSNSIEGTGVNFTANTRVGDALLAPDGKWYEIINVPDSTHITVSPNYLGVTAVTQTYKIAPIQGYVKASADLLREATINLAGRLEVIDSLDETELAALDGISGNIQTQLNSKITSNAVLVGTTASFTTELETKLASIDENAEENVNADWNAVSGDAQILNKPALAAIATSGSASDLAVGTISDDRLPAVMAAKTFTGITVLPALTSIGDVTAVELEYMKGVTGYIQTQLNNKQTLSSVLTNTTASYTIEEQVKLSNIDNGATINNPDSFLLSRANHTGTQSQSTISNLVSDLAAKQNASTVLTNTTAAFTTDLETKLNSIAAGATVNSADSFLLSRANHTGTQTADTISNFNSAVESKLVSTLSPGSNISIVYDDLSNTITISASGGGGGGGGGSTDLSVSRTSTQVTVASSTGSSAILLSANSTEAGILSAANFNKLGTIAENATSNFTNTYLLDRTNHTGSQSQSTITGLTTALAAKQDTLVSATNIKTVNGQNILGSGDLVVETSPFDSSTDAYIRRVRTLALGAM